MKKIFSFIAAVLFAGSMMAADATITLGNKAYNATVNEVVGVKCGTSNASGDMTLTVGAGATKLSFYAVAWKGAAGNINISAPDGVTVSATTIDIEANDAISGSSNDFTISGDISGYAFALTLSGVEESTEIKFESGSARRFVVWGATYETGEGGGGLEVATPVISGEASFEESTTVTITCATDDAAIYYTLDGTTPTDASTPYDEPFEIEETTTVKAIAILDEVSSSVASKTFTKVEPLADPTNCAEAREAALSVSEDNEEYNGGKEYTIEGYVTGIKTAYSEQHSNISFWMADEAEGGEVLQAFRAACASAEAAPNVGDKVSVTGKLTKYKGTPEFAAACTFEILERTAAPENLGEKTIEEFIALKNTKDTCILTGKVIDIKDAEYGNLTIEDATGELYIYGVLTPTGEKKQFSTLDVAVNDVLTVKAIYNEYQGNPQATNAIFVSREKAQVTAIDNTDAEMKVQKVVRDGQLFIIRNGVMFNVTGQNVR